MEEEKEIARKISETVSSLNSLVRRGEEMGLEVLIRDTTTYPKAPQFRCMINKVVKLGESIPVNDQLYSAPTPKIIT